MKNYSTNEHRADILQFLNLNNRVTVNELCEKYGLSEVTIRKDLEILKNRNLLFRIRGGAIRIPAINIEGMMFELNQKDYFTTNKKRQ